ncbi:class I SAM-dependent methyltransferase (plasmid) [Azospirillum brasilense]|uniref:Class I SAM-dependent methyltransferase n=1 Tax=Azospirillum brasilense TaxID=192 RepID=A0A4D8RAB4_AZOBR|nr:class I SAM-dependent methyltransferase [Azospirillum brasilense]QCO19898.1 class I SAM-dependent methyltransferase [Azospirillum brasilense]
MIRDDGWTRNSIWEHSATVRDLYARRCRQEAEEMTCAAQAVRLLAPYAAPGDTVLDVGCGSGYFFHSLVRAGIRADYVGIDASPGLIAIGRQEMPAFGLPAERLRVLRIDDLDGEADHVVCMNVLSNIDNYHRPLERLLKVGRKTLILRESLADRASCLYVRDNYLDDGVDLRVHVNTYDKAEVLAFIRAAGWSPTVVEDERTNGKPEMIIGYPHHWTFIVAVRS